MAGVVPMIAEKDSICFICCSMSFEGDEVFLVDHPIHNEITLCALCGIAAERLGWIVC